ncbi:hypothetical protein Bca52824_004221 [Brassica carinata]|uniref:Uncharacterized protein n=1 Tax=Brassica carinata TaxID=52824 RepID=A0A8X7WNK1_BRACI|nr:hypothetical protein Bca52824_004221 [Brassica carinata]
MSVKKLQAMKRQLEAALIATQQYEATVARGDLGAEIPVDEVLIPQNDKANQVTSK